MTLISTREMTIWILSLAYLFGPGLLVTFWLFPDERPSWQIIVGGGVGIALIGLTALGLSFSPLGITQASVLVVGVALNGLFVIPFCGAPERVVQRWARLFKAFFSAGRSGKPDWQDHLRDYLTFAVALVSLFAFLVVALFLSRGDEKSYTEFYIVDGLAEAPLWRCLAAPSDLVSITFAVVSSEKTAESFQVHIMTEGETAWLFPLGVLEPGASVEQSISIPPPTESEQRYILDLYKGDSAMPYRTLYFWLQTLPESASSDTEGKTATR
jgi:uncharacterized membrane protein